MIKVRNPIKAKIDDQYNYLQLLMERFPQLLEEYKEIKDDEFRKIAHRTAAGDKEVELSISSELLKCLESLPTEEEMFYSAIFLMIYAYYESCLNLLVKGLGVKSKIDAICRDENLTLTSEMSDKVNFLNDKIRIIRNHMTHNGYDSSDCQDLKEVLSSIGEVHMVDDKIVIADKDFLINVLNKEHDILMFLLNRKKTKNGKKNKQTKSYVV